MDPKKAYELTIAEKLGALPLPDLKESIWSRIEDQLDIDLPTDDGGGGSGPHSPDWGSYLRFGGPFAVIVALVTLYLVNRQKNKTQPVQRSNAVPSAQTISSSKKEGPPNKAAPAVFPGIKKPLATPGAIVPGDSVSAIDPVITFTPPPAALDTIAQQTPPLVVATPPPAPKDTMRKKPKGVTGITDGDYRIVPKKDSTKKE
jgi:hypothetical protein